MSQIDDIIASLNCYPIRPAFRRNPSESELERFEQLLGGRLPSDYRAFLSRYGQTMMGRGARFEILEPNPWGRTASVDQFFGFSTDQSEDIVHLTMETYSGRIPDETLPIGSDAGGNLILLGFDGPVTDHVFFWDHEHREIGDRLEQMAAAVEAKGVDTSSLDDEALIRHWERLFPDQLTKPIGYGNMYKVADSFKTFIESLRPDSE